MGLGPARGYRRRRRAGVLVFALGLEALPHERPGVTAGLGYYLEYGPIG